MPITFGVFRNEANDGDDGDVSGDDDYGGGAAGPVNSLLAQALWHTRGDLTSGIPVPDATEFASTMGQLPAENIFGRWSPDVRAHLYSFELLSGLHFKHDGAGALLLSLTVAQNGTPSFSQPPLASVTRPEYDIDENALKEELAKVMTAIALRPERMAEILTQIQVPYSFFGSVMNLQGGRHRYTFELMSAAFRLSSAVVMQFKNHLRVRRPAERSPLVQPVLPTPGHGSYPAGHATQCYLVAAVLKALLDEAVTPGRDALAGQLDKLAERVAYNRVVAGLHYEKDNEVGAGLGIALAGYFVQRVRDGKHPALAWLWARAFDEWKNL
jgi:hypothetical protein